MDRAADLLPLCKLDVDGNPELNTTSVFYFGTISFPVRILYLGGATTSVLEIGTINSQCEFDPLLETPRMTPTGLEKWQNNHEAVPCG